MTGPARGAGTAPSPRPPPGGKNVHIAVLESQFLEEDWDSLSELFASDIHIAGRQLFHADFQEKG